MDLDSRQSGCEQRNCSVLVEISTFKDNCMLCGWIVELPALVAIWTPTEHIFLIVRLECVTLVLLDMHIGSQSLDLKVGHI